MTQRTPAVSLALLAGVLAAPLGAQTISAQVVASGFTNPVDLKAPPGDARLFLVELSGQVRVRVGGSFLATPFLDVSALIQGGPFTGLRGVAFHPDYASNGHVYLWYEEKSTGQPDIVIDRMTVSATDPNVADPTTRVEILRFAQEQQWHGGGGLAFGPDGYLYLGTGDGWGLGDDPGCNAQNGGVLKGKMLRIDVDSAFPYAIPPDNPFVGDPNVLDEIFHLGLRHPWRWSFDRATGDMYIGDVGQSSVEEVDFVPAGVGGLNFGWKVMEGESCYSTSGCNNPPPCHDPAYTLPIHTYPHGSSGCSIIGGFVYRGAAIPSLQGAYLYGDWCTGRIWSFRYENGTVDDLQDRSGELGGTFGNILSIGEDAGGELYFMNSAGTLYQIVPDCTATSYCDETQNPNNAADIAIDTCVLSPGNTVHLSGGPPGQFCYLLLGNGTATVSQPPGSNGDLCVVGGSCLGRYSKDIGSIDAGGAFSTDVSNSASGGPSFGIPTCGGTVQPGETWAFQFWHRQPMGQPSTFSAALAVTFQ